MGYNKVIYNVIEKFKKIKLFSAKPSFLMYITLKKSCFPDSEPTSLTTKGKTYKVVVFRKKENRGSFLF